MRTPLDHRAYVLRLIHQHGIVRIARAMRNPGTQFVEGWDLTRWLVQQPDTSSLVLKYAPFVDGANPERDPNGWVTALMDARRLVRRNNPHTWSLARLDRDCHCELTRHSDVDQRRHVEAAWRRETELTNEIEDLLAEYGQPDRIVETQVVCVVTEPARWHETLKEVAALPIPSALLLCAVGGRVIYGTNPFTQPRFRRPVSTAADRARAEGDAAAFDAAFGEAVDG